MRITFVLPSFVSRPIGGFRVVYQYANQLAARGHAVTVVHARRLANSPPPLNLQQRLHRQISSIRNLVLRPRSVAWQPIDEKVRMLHVPEAVPRYIPAADAVFATAWQTAVYVLGYPDSKGEKFYLIQHYETWSGPKEKVDATWKAPFHKVVISKWLYEIGLGLECGEIAHISNGIDHDLFRLLTPIANRPKRVAMLYSRLDWKGSPEGLAALEVVKRRCPDLQAVMFGTSSRSSLIPKWIEYHRDPRQEFLVKAIYNGSSIFLCTSWMEGFALPPAEAMACGCAVVSTDCGGIGDYAEHGTNALLSPPRDPEALAENILRLLEDDPLRQRIALAGRKRIQEFTWGRSTDLLEQFIEKHTAGSLEAPHLGFEGRRASRPRSSE